MTKEFSFTRNDFQQVRKIVGQTAGINLGEHKYEMVYGRLARRLRSTGIKKVSDYLAFMQDDPEENIQFINAITTNLTYFFRESHHFDFLSSTVIDSVVKTHSNDKRVRIWSAGCSTGEEPYSIAWSMRLFRKKYESWDFKILATDLDTAVLNTARQGIYGEERIQKLDKSIISKLFSSVGSGRYQVKSQFRKDIFYKKLNLMNSNWPMKGKFDVIFCRNVLIYFDRPTQQKLIEKFRQNLHQNGYLILGHSESIGSQLKNFQPIGRTIFQKR
ncbi:CheR family methyltransferase [Pleionea sediminis]|uniref:CheR family methyltransferase n=1 Tax=Pleionea sediminis TaxID=2569479 RepID=UPI001184D579|nr:protein-glutamate O-methyltransferase CheR [Pleionea sediminis]